jgi:hypothetical protein
MIVSLWTNSYAVDLEQSLRRLWKLVQFHKTFARFPTIFQNRKVYKLLAVQKEVWIKKTANS